MARVWREHRTETRLDSTRFDWQSLRGRLCTVNWLTYLRCRSASALAGRSNSSWGYRSALPDFDSPSAWNCGVSILMINVIIYARCGWLIPGMARPRWVGGWCWSVQVVFNTFRPAADQILANLLALQSLRQLQYYRVRSQILCYQHKIMYVLYIVVLQREMLCFWICIPFQLFTLSIRVILDHLYRGFE